MTQQWTELAYVHWRYEPEVVQALLPPGLVVDTFDGSAWVGLIPFEMIDVRIGPFGKVPYLSSFTEVNVRTYVVDETGRRSVWFFSLDVPKSPIVGVARSLFALPYCWARTRHHTTGRWHRYEIARRWPGRGAHADISFLVDDAIEPDDVSELDRFLTARWSLVTERRGRLRRGDVAHPSWPLRRAELVHLDQSLVEAAGLPSPSGEPHVLYSPGVAVDIGSFHRLSSS